MKNYNELITTDFPKVEDFYIGMYIQTFGNSKTIYKINNIIINSETNSIKEINFKASHHIIDIYTIGKGKALLANLKELMYEFDQRTSQFEKIIETIYTDQLNIDVKRNKKIKLLGL